MAEDVLELLAREHREVSRLIVEYEQNAAFERAREIVERLIELLVRHGVAEEQVVYPVAQRVLEQEMVDLMVGEHRHAEAVMRCLEGAGPDLNVFHTMTRRLINDVRQHVWEEENRVFPALRAGLPLDERRRLGGQYEAAWRAAPVRPHPERPHGAAANRAVGPALAVVDRVRNRLGSSG